MTMRAFAVPLVVLVAVAAGVFGFTASVSAATEYISVPAAAFPLGGNTSYLSTSAAIEGNGVDVVRAPVYFKTQQLNVCNLSVWAHDFDGTHDVTARLMRKRIAPDGTPFGLAPVTMASVSSADFEDVLRVFSTTTITAPRVSPNFFYWVELDFSGGPIQVTGVRVFTATTCP